MSKLRLTKVLLFIFACVMGGMSANAQTVKQDVLNQTATGVSGSSYKDVTVSATTSGAVYAVNCAGGNASIQLRSKNNNSGIVTTQTAGKAKKVTVEWQSSTSAGRQLDVYGSNTPYTKPTDLYGTATQGELLGSIVMGTSTTLDITGDYAYVAMRSKNGAMYLTSVTIDWEQSGTPGEIIVANPTLSEATKTFTAPFDVTITTTTEGASIYYTTDGTVPSQTTGTLYQQAIRIDQTTTLKAIAVKGEKSSDVVEATYTKLNITNDGSFAKPYTPAEFILVNPTTTEVWVKGTILGNADSKNDGYNAAGTVNSNVCIGEAGLDKCIGIKIANDNALRELNLQNLKGQTLMVQGKAGSYFSRTGITNPQLLLITDGEPLAKMEVNTKEGYSTFFNANAVQVPEGVECGIVTGVANGVLTVDYQYTAGKEIPANTPVIVKAKEMKAYPLTISTTTTAAPTGNLLRGAATDGMLTPEATGSYYYYKLAYDDFTAKTGLGFYWGEANGGAFAMKAGKAYLAVEQTVAQGAQKLSLEGGATGIDEVEQTVNADRAIYTLDGRRVMNQQLSKGIYIMGGKKVYVK